MEPPDILLFASDATIFCALGAGLLAVALVALVAERMRMKRARIDRVGWVPWTGLFLTCAVVGGGLLAVGVPGLLAG